MTMKKARGFTLIEFMIVVAVVAILGALAYPSYRDSVLKGRRAQARTALSELLQQQERFMTQRNCYMPFTTNSSGVSAVDSGATGASSCSFPATVPFRGFSSDGMSNSYYLLSAKACPGGTSVAVCIEVDATPIQSDPEVDVLKLSSSGTRDCSGTAQSTNFKLCWP